MPPEETGELRAVDGRPVNSPYDESVIFHARGLYALGDEISVIADRMRINPALIKGWKEKQKPDGTDWDVCREQIGPQTVDAMLDQVGPQTSEDLARQLLRGAQKALSLALSALDTPQLYDENEEIVEFLYTAKGKPVQITLRPETTNQITNLINSAHKVMKETTELIREAEETRYRRYVASGEMDRRAFQNLIQELKLLMSRGGPLSEEAEALLEELKRSASAFNKEGPSAGDYEPLEGDWKQLTEAAPELPAE